MAPQATSSTPSDDKNWPKLGMGKSSAPTPPKAGSIRPQPVCGAGGNSSDQAPSFIKSMTGVGDQRLVSGAVNKTSGNTARPTYPKLVLKSTEPEPRSISFSDIVRRGSPPPSPTLPTLLPPPTLKISDTPATGKRANKPLAQPAGIVATDSFPPLSQAPSSTLTSNAPARKGSYAAATGTWASANSKTRPTVTTGACASARVSESAVTVLSPGSSAKVMSVNIGTVRPATPPPAPLPCHPPRTPRRKNRSVSQNTLSPPVEGRTRSGSVSSIATSIATSVVTSSSRGPASSKTSVCPSICHTPISDDLEWRLKLTELARKMSGSQRAAWEKILRCDPKDTSKMKWNAFDKALRALLFKPQTRGGSETEYTPDPEYFGPKAQPISYHRPHPGSDFTLGDLKAKSNSFRQQYPEAVAVLHDAWGVVDTRL